MAPPSSYTEDSFKTYLHSTIAPIAQALDWTVALGSYDNVLADTLLNYGESDITQISGMANILKLRVLAKVYLWRAVVAQLALDYDFEADGGKYNRSQMQEMALKTLAQAETEAGQYDNSLRVYIDKFDHTNDPYQYKESED